MALGKLSRAGVFTCSALAMALAGARDSSAGPQAVTAGSAGGNPTARNFLPRTKPDVFELAPYRRLDNVGKEWVNLNLPAVRPMIVVGANEHTFALNTHDSTVLHLDANVPGIEETTYRVPWGPVALAAWIAPDLSDKLLVVCRGTHVLAVLDMFSGDIEDLIGLEFEPADILVDQAANLAYVACSGADSVVEIDLVAGAMSRSWKLPSKHPMFLSWDAGTVLVAPMFSGNNSSFIPGPVIEVVGILDLADPAIATVGLPDEDLYRIDPVADTIAPVATGMGTVLFGHGINPATGDLWLLNTEHINKDPNKQTEPLVNGEFAENRLTITTLDPGGAVVSNHQFLNLDDTNPATQAIDFDTTRTVGQPWGLAFASNGFALVTGLGTDNVTLLDAAGNFVLEWDTGSIPRQAVFDVTETLALVHCWGDNMLEVYSIVPFSPIPILTFDLGHDPTPPIAQEGRAIAYSSSNSLNNNLSCFSCHVEGGTDFLIWNLSGPPEDRKGPLVTQNLAGIEKLNPYHWRGERPALVDFNGAFAGLLGGSELSTGPGSDFEKFQNFVFTIEPPANPGQHPERVISSALFRDAPNGEVANAVRGQETFFDKPAIGSATCQDCHTMPTGTNNDIQNVSFGNIDGHQNSLFATAFNRMWAKEMPSTTISLTAGGNREVAVLGAGVSHGGDRDDLFDFINLFGFSPQEKADVWSLVSQWDSGLAPAVHEGVHIAQGFSQQDEVALTFHLLPQAKKRNCDLVCMGTVQVAGSPAFVAWYFDREDGLFHPEDSSLSAQPLSYFLDQAQAGLASNSFFGLPLGMGKRFAADYDADDLLNGNEIVETTALYDADSDDDGFLDGQEIQFGSDPTDDLSLPNDTQDPVISDLSLQWNTTRVARLSWSTSEPTSYVIDYSTPAAPASSSSSSTFESVRSVLLRDLLPSTDGFLTHTYTGTLTVTDAAGRTAAMPIPAITTATFEDLDGPIFESVVGDLQWTNLSTFGGSLSATTEVRVDFKAGGPPAVAMANQIVIARVLVNGALSTNWTNTGEPTSFKTFGVAYASLPFALDGPFLISQVPTDAGGLTDFSFTQPGLSPGDEVTVNIEYIITVNPNLHDPNDPDFGTGNNSLPLAWWSFPDTLKDLRKLTTTF